MYTYRVHIHIFVYFGTKFCYTQKNAHIIKTVLYAFQHTYTHTRTPLYRQERTTAYYLRSCNVILGKSLCTHTKNANIHISLKYRKSKYPFIHFYPFILRAVYAEISSVSYSNIKKRINSHVSTQQYSQAHTHEFEP